MLKNKLSEASLEDDNYIQNMSFENEVLTDINISKFEFKSVQFTKSQFMNCNFSGASFYDVIFENCLFSNCIFTDSYWKKSKILECKGDGSNFSQSLFKETALCNSSFCYVNCAKSVWDGCTISDSNFKEAFLTEVKFRKPRLKAVNLQRADFFKTPLKGIDLSDCTIDGIMVSDTFSELKGAKINAMQAIELVQILGVKII